VTPTSLSNLRLSWSLAVLLAYAPAVMAGPSSAAPVCNARFVSGSDQVEASLNGTCSAVRRLEPSICQRALVDRCGRSLQEVKRIRENVCRNLRSEGKFIESRQHGETDTSQRAAQEANSGLNREASVVSESMATLVELERKKIDGLIGENQRLLGADACRKSSVFGSYRASADQLNTGLQAKKVLLEGFGRRKQHEAQVAEKKSVESANHAEGLTSLTPMVQGDAVSGSSKSSKLIPMAAIGGIAGAGLLMAAANGNYGPPIEGISPGPAVSGGTAPNMDAYKGDSDRFLEENGILVDKSFKDSEKAQIAQALNYVPACHRAKLRGLKVENNPGLRWRKAEYRGRCLPGINSGPKRIQLNPTCYRQGISTALVVHEMIHVIANQSGMYGRYAATYHRYPGCPVTQYAQMNFNLHEDFTEAARLAIYPGSGGQLSNQCSLHKVSAAREIMGACR
jgi:hypothetical protein